MHTGSPTGSGEHELHSTHQGLSNKATSHDVQRVLKVSSQSLTRKSRHVLASAQCHLKNRWSHNYLTRACMVILSTPSVLAHHFT